MYRLSLMIILLLPIATPTRADDFSGFYAGVNAGYALGKERDRTVTTPSQGPGAGLDRPGAGTDLPPSARDAAAVLQRAGRSGAGAATAR